MTSKDLKGIDWVFPQRIAYVVSHSIVRSSDGYAVRTQDVARTLVERGHEVIVFNQPGHPWIDTDDALSEQIKLDQKIDGVRYIYLPYSKPELRPEKQLALARDSLRDAFRIFRPALVMAASNWKVAEPAQEAAKQYGCPFFYEQRGFWELSLEEGPEQDLCQNRETRIAQNASAVFTLNSIMKETLVDRGVPNSKIHLVPNGIAKIPEKPSRFGRNDIGCKSKYLLGYIGSLSAYEGISDLVHLIDMLQKDNLDTDLMIVGSDAPQGLVGKQKGPQELKLHALVRELGLTEAIHFVPRVHAKEISDYYRLVDAVVLPRRRSVMTDIVPPLKPYTAAAHNVPIYLSDIQPHCEIAREINATLFPAGDILALSKLIENSLLSTKMPMPKARNEALGERISWGNRIQPMLDLFAGVSAQSEPAFNQAWAVSPHKEPQDIEHEKPNRFNTKVLPRVGLKFLSGNRTVACLGPGENIPGGMFLRLTRQNILETLATQEVGVFIIDWAGLQRTPDEWADLWGLSNMRLNRLVMDACRIGLDRGWDMWVVGPVSRSKAPLFSTVSGVLAETVPHMLRNDLGKT